MPSCDAMTHEELVVEWTQGNTCRGIAEKYGLRPDTVAKRIQRLRRLGVALEVRRFKAKADVGELNRIIEANGSATKAA
jgi:DNA-binding Lrp family transcriptional regulator